MNNQLKTLPRTLGVAALLAQSFVFFACSSSSPASGTGGQPAGPQGGATGAQGGASGTAGVSGGGGAGGVVCALYPGSCTCTGPNPDSNAGGACSSAGQSVSSGLLCTQDCCVTCGIDQLGTKTCTCPNIGQVYANCSCPAPAGFPTNSDGTALTGGFCSPQGYSTSMPPATAPAGAISLKGVACTKINTVCFTQDSTTGSERGCVCMMDPATGMASLHCGSVNHWFVNSNAAATTYN